MTAYLFRRFLSGVLVVFAVAALTFLFQRAVPGGPFTTEKGLPPEVLENLKKHYGLDAPVPVQLARVLAGVPVLDFGDSMKYRGRAVRDILLDAAPASLQLGLQAFVLAVALGLSLGFVSGWRRAKGGAKDFTDGALQVFTAMGVALPNFVVAGILILFFSFYWPILPPARWEGPLHSILPSLALAAAPTAYIARLARSSLLSALSEPHIRTARAKGVSEGAVILRHAVPGALYTILTILGPLLAALVTGSFVIETVFGIPGMGRFFVSSVVDRDYTVILGITVFYTAILAGANLAVDLLYTLADPRVRVGKEGS